MTKHKNLKIILIIAAALIVAAAAAFGIFTLNTRAVRFDYSDYICVGNINVPFFANKLSVSNPPVYNGGWLWGEDNIVVYEQLNSPLRGFATTLYRNNKGENINISHTTDITNNIVTVKFTGTAGSEQINQEFVFDITNASQKNLPKWTNYSEESDGWFYSKAAYDAKYA